MLKLIPALVAVALFVSPALAHDDFDQSCMTPDKLRESAPPQYQYKDRIEGDKLAKLVKMFPDIHVPPQADLLLIFTFPIPERFAVQIFSGGCHIGNGWITKDVMTKVEATPKTGDDGKL